MDRFEPRQSVDGCLFNHDQVVHLAYAKLVALNNEATMGNNEVESMSLRPTRFYAFRKASVC